ncbi:helix-turn-helix transcriptional regulator [Aquabacter spiritensis]|uniref:AraC family transcriptional regulator n=1 Tax=Aquabacter spiritensis TaxID=933073 RepID=A0A4V6NZJ8_9HYPH|nr:AraC family transcriptional regulator [Aquabacter spiritensis]TCT05478.1 AraC family transcriptional regulator [Aquabacter spiritensis]
MTFKPRMTSRLEGITVLDELSWRRWNGVVADVWHVRCAAGARGHYVSNDARLFVVLERHGGSTNVQLSAHGTDVSPHPTPHHMSFVPAHMPLWSRIDEPLRLRHLDLHFDVATLSERLGEDLAPDRLATPRLGFADDRLLALARLIAAECSEPGRHDLYGDSLVMALFIDVLQLGRATPARRTPLTERQLRRVTAFIEENCLRNIRLGELAELTDLSQSYFSHAFKAATGLPPHQWHMKARMRRVEAMLARPDLPLTEIAAAAGFADQAHFTRTFRRLAGVTPAAWRRAQRT